ncbi:hypothetical protein [Nonomuraea sp. NPDC046570]|uniref:hypothetical protein n=1 Tax=Nonomuraea sp. NPDC046570 TaxID=3155255 RepID=UPI0034006F0D
MTARFGMRASALLAGAVATGILTMGAGTAAHADTDETILLKGSTTASYFWDDSSGRAGDTGLPASGKPMQKGLAASPSWPLHTEGYVVYKGKKAKFFVGDRGPGVPSNNGIMLDLDAKTFAELTGGRFNSSTLGVDGVGGQGHIDVQYIITKWGDGVGKKNHPVAFASGAWGRMDRNPAAPPKVVEAAPKKAEPKKAESVKAAPEKVVVAPAKADLRGGNAAQAAAQTETKGAGDIGAMLTVAGGLTLLGGGLYGNRDRLRKATSR